MKYTEGYLAFLDILGFSQFVSNEENGDKTADLFKFVRNFCYFFNSSEKLKSNVAFFSDSIVITSEDMSSLMCTIIFAEMYLQDSLGLLYRGGICWGKYYHENGVTFGPAVVEAYKLEQKANYSRIIFSPNINMKKWNNSLMVFKDIDGYYCVNPFLLAVDERTKFGEKEIEYPEGNPDEILLDILKTHRDKVLTSIDKHRGTTVVDKYLWRIRAFNYTCDSIANNQDKIDLLTENGVVPSEELKNKLFALKIVFL